MSNYRSIAIAFTALASIALALPACGSDEEEPAATETTAEAAPTEPAPAPTPAQQPTPAPGASTITLRPGFMPDPHTATGTTGGSVDASTLSQGCTGNVSRQPDHVLTAEAAFSTLRIMAHSNTDTTLVVQRPDQSYVCNDDGDGLDPLVEITDAPAGDYRIWVGTWGAEAQDAYTLGVSEMSSVTPSTLGG